MYFAGYRQTGAGVEFVSLSDAILSLSIDYTLLPVLLKVCCCCILNCKKQRLTGCAITNILIVMLYLVVTSIRAWGFLQDFFHYCYYYYQQRYVILFILFIIVESTDSEVLPVYGGQTCQQSPA